MAVPQSAHIAHTNLLQKLEGSFNKMIQTGKNQIPVYENRMKTLASTLKNDFHPMNDKGIYSYGMPPKIK